MINLFSHNTNFYSLLLQVTNRNQKEAFNKVRWTMSRFAQCNQLESGFVGPLKLVLTRSKCK